MQKKLLKQKKFWPGLTRLSRSISGQKRKIKKDRTKEFLQDEIELIKIHKWIESEKAKRDLGVTAELDWICKYAASYRAEWEMLHGKIIEETEEDGVCCSGYERSGS